MTQKRQEGALLDLENVGVAPIYRPYRLALRFQQGTRSFISVLKKDIRD